MKPIHIIAVGKFGLEVATQIEKRVGHTVVTEMPERLPLLPSDRFPVARLHILASWKPVSSLSKMMDNLSFAWNVPWIPIVLNHPQLQIGPVVTPKEGPCFHCYEKRVLQHSPFPGHIHAMHHYYDQTPTAGPKGYVRAFAGWSASHILYIDSILTIGDEDVSGCLWQMDVLTRESCRSLVVGVHGCPRCGLGRSEKDRSVDQLMIDMERVSEYARVKEEVLN
ncbi:TOMM precursor leader peptide-binding protein [Bacillus sp. FSL W7-1360]